MLCTKNVLNAKTKAKNYFYTQHALNLYFCCSRELMNNLSYCGLTDSRMSASEKDLPVRNISSDEPLPGRLFLS